MARKRYRTRPMTSNYDRRDGLKVHRISDNMYVSRYSGTITLFDADNIVLDQEGKKGFINVSIARSLRRLNRLKCNRINGYNGKLNGRE